MSQKRRGWLVYGLLLIAALSFRAAVARFLPNDDPGDGKIYAQIARNLLEHHVYSTSEEPPYNPTLIRLPGYPALLAAVYAVFGHQDNAAVRIVQALIDTAACALAAILAFHWEPDVRRKRAASIAALALAAICPFTTIYVATILTETPTICLTVAMALTATLAFKASSWEQSVTLWIITGVICGLAVMCRPDSGLFAVAIGITLIFSMLFLQVNDGELQSNLRRRFYAAAFLAGLFSLTFGLILSPWTLRNRRVFGVFQPLAPAHAEMPGEFVPRGYLMWLRTWLDDERYIGPYIWSLDELPIRVSRMPSKAFDSPDEKLRVATLLEKYNQRPEEELQAPANKQPGATPSPSPAEGLVSQAQSSPTVEETPSAQVGQDQGEEDQGEEDQEADNGDEDDDSESADEVAANGSQPVEMTPEIDAGFAAIARERIARAPLRYYLWLPAKRAATMWLNTHSQYYPFEGELLPLEDLDYENHQQYWLPLFAGLTALYTVLGLCGAWFLLRSSDPAAQRWLLLAALMIFLRLGFFSTIENPEPRYMVEIFPFLSTLGGIAIAHFPQFAVGKVGKSRKGGAPLQV